MNEHDIRKWWASLLAESMSRKYECLLPDGDGGGFGKPEEMEDEHTQPLQYDPVLKKYVPKVLDTTPRKSVAPPPPTAVKPTTWTCFASDLCRSGTSNEIGHKCWRCGKPEGAAVLRQFWMKK